MFADIANATAAGLGVEHNGKHFQATAAGTLGLTDAFRFVDPAEDFDDWLKGKIEDGEYQDVADFVLEADKRTKRRDKPKRRSGLKGMGRRRWRDRLCSTLPCRPGR